MKRLSIGLQLLCALLVSVHAVAHAAPAHGKKKAKKGAPEPVPVSTEPTSGGTSPPQTPVSQEAMQRD